MATYDALSVQDKAILDTFTQMVRAWAGEQARLNYTADVLNTFYNAQVIPVLGRLDAGGLVPNKSGLSGAVDLLKEDVVSMVAHIQGILSNYNTVGHRQLWTSAAGPENVVR